MGNYELLKAAINEVIKANGRQEITGEVLNQVLLSMVNSLGAGYQCMGVATPSTNPGTPDQNVFYFATQAGTYTNFGAIVLQAGISVLIWDGDWASQTWFTVDATPTNNSQNLIASGAVFNAFKLDGGAYDVSAHNSGATFASLSALLNSANLNTLIPAEIRHGGMSIKYVQSSDNKYVQYRLMSDTFNTTVANWQGVDEKPTTGSDNLVKSGGVAVVDKIARGIANTTWEKKNIAGADYNSRLTSSLIEANVGDSFLFSCSSGYVASVFAIKSNNTYTTIVDSLENGTFVIPSDYIGFKITLRTNPDGGTMSLNDWNKFSLYKDIFNASKANSGVLFNGSIIKRNQVASFSDVTWEKKNVAGVDMDIRLTSSLIPGSAGDVFIFSAKNGYMANIYSFKEDNTYTKIADSLENTFFSLPADSVGFKVSINTNPNVGNMELDDWINVKVYADVADILNNISSLSTKTDVLEKFLNKIVLGSEVTWEYKNIAGASSNIRLTSSLITAIPNKEYILELRDTRYCFSVFNFTGESAYTSMFDSVNSCSFTVPENSIGFKVTIRKNPDSSQTIPFTATDTFDAFINQFQKKNGFIHLNLGSYNVMEYFNPSIFPQITTELRDSWIENFKHMMNTLGKTDILFAQEDNTVYKYSDAQDRNVYNDLYKQMFPYKYCCGFSLPSIYSKYKLYNGRTITINVDTGSVSYTRKHAFAEINIEGKKIALLSIHGGIHGEAGLRAEFSAIINELSNYDYVIIGGDTNADSYNGVPLVAQPVGFNPVITETFGAAGYETSNFDYWGNFITQRDPFGSEHDKCIDTFLTKNLSICSFDVLTESDQRDHYPIMSDVTLSFD